MQRKRTQKVVKLKSHFLEIPQESVSKNLEKGFCLAQDASDIESNEYPVLHGNIYFRKYYLFVIKI